MYDGYELGMALMIPPLRSMVDSYGYGLPAYSAFLDLEVSFESFTPLMLLMSWFGGGFSLGELP
ncbi:hypothetical protein CTI12_AA184610 [Artemisia annua]|uniref:Uncharacterized protein n=1 Tax=Artemisia annua TaxID=35608 RepID=A0A2U1N755_ARTAN|nr:hypothetical protein CTI12_AA184610 [Artemisia annua]